MISERLRSVTNGNVSASTEARRLSWPAGKRFAFTVVDDTEMATIDNVGPVYDLLGSLGVHTTKTVWPCGFQRPPRFGGDTLDEPEYLRWIRSLADDGFEIAFHGATDHASLREGTVAALNSFRERLGADPRVHVNHFGQSEALYWGDARLDGLPKLAYRGVNRLLGRAEHYYGHDDRSPYFWGDICRDRVEYVRNYTFPGVLTTSMDALMPYHDPRRPYVNFWFSSSDAPRVEAFCDLLSEANQDRLCEEGGACIVYTHFAFGFTEAGTLHRRFEHLMRRLSALPGWFVPVSTLLDHLKVQEGWRPEPDIEEIRKLQMRWLRARMLHGRL
jgi:hypothetical protein